MTKTNKQYSLYCLNAIGLFNFQVFWGNTFFKTATLTGSVVSALSLNSYISFHFIRTLKSPKSISS